MFLLAAAIGYLLGALPWAYAVGRILYEVDIRKQGSGNPGATNVFRVLGLPAGALVLAGDVLKGWLAVTLGFLLGGADQEFAPVAAGLGAILGHTFSVFLRFEGGKGVATAAGVLLALMPLKILGLLLLGWMAVVLATRYVSVASMAVAAGFPLLVLYFEQPLSYLVFSLAAAAVIVYRHRSNILRLMQGQELRMSWRRGG